MTSTTCLTALVLLTVSSSLVASGDDTDLNALKVSGLHVHNGLVIAARRLCGRYVFVAGSSHTNSD